MKGEDVVITKRDKLKDVQFSLKDKHNRESNELLFSKKIMNVQLVNKKLMKTLKSKRLNRQTSVEKLEEGLNKMSDEMKKVEETLQEYKKLSKKYKQMKLRCRNIVVLSLN